MQGVCACFKVNFVNSAGGMAQKLTNKLTLYERQQQIPLFLASISPNGVNKTDHNKHSKSKCLPFSDYIATTERQHKFGPRS